MPKPELGRYKAQHMYRLVENSVSSPQLPEIQKELDDRVILLTQPSNLVLISRGWFSSALSHLVFARIGHCSGFLGREVF